MARRSKTSLENEVERSRWEEKWECIPKLVDQLSSRTTSEPSIGEFLLSSSNFFGNYQLDFTLNFHQHGY